MMRFNNVVGRPIVGSWNPRSLTVVVSFPRTADGMRRKYDKALAFRLLPHLTKFHHDPQQNMHAIELPISHTGIIIE